MMFLNNRIVYKNGPSTPDAELSFAIEQAGRNALSRYKLNQIAEGDAPGERRDDTRESILRIDEGLLN